MIKVAKNKYGAIIIEGHVQGLANVRSLGKAGIPVVVIDKGLCVAASSVYCNSFYKCPDYNSDEFIDFIVNLAIEKGYKDWVIIPSNDHAVYNISKNLQRIKNYYKTTIPSIDIIDKIYDKANLLKLANSLNVPIPETYYFDHTSDISINELKYPILTKGKAGLSFYKSLKRKAFLSNDRKELISHLEIIKKEIPLEETFSQELIPFDGNNKTISLAVFCIDGEIKTYWMGVKLREHPIQFGTATYTESVFEEDCLMRSKVLLKELNYTGVCEVEFLKDPRDNQFKLIEINARTWLWVGHAIANGINFPLYIYNYLNGVNISFPTQYELGLKWRNPFSDVIFTSLALIKGKIGLSHIMSKGKTVSALWDSEDRKPFFKYAQLMINFVKNR